jgi:flavin reductase (DIM6/NTAB) family NADH-FMN oxidoreductase RutF
MPPARTFDSKGQNDSLMPPDFERKLTGMTIHMPNIAETPIDERHLRNALGRFATGVTVITTRSASGKLEGLTANSFTAVSLDPPLISWSLKRSAPSRDNFISARHFAVNVLSCDQHALCRHFATPRHDKFETVDFEHGVNGAPILPGCLATFECRTESTFEGGDHLIFIGRVLRAAHRDGEPLIFSAGRLCLPAALEEPATAAKTGGTLSEDWEGLSL